MVADFVKRDERRNLRNCSCVCTTAFKKWMGAEAEKRALKKGLQVLSYVVYDYGPKEGVPESLHRRFIDYGYRNSYSLWKTFRSLFTLHNETLNIWSHLIGFACAITAVTNFMWDEYYTVASSHRGIEFSELEGLTVCVYLICAGSCFLLSSIYHWFNCLHEHADCLLKFDQIGIAILIGSSFFPAIYFGFYCRPILQKIYMFLSLVVLVVGLYAPWIKSKFWGMPLKNSVFAALVMMGLIPSFHWYIITPPLFRTHLLPGVVMLFFWYGLGFVFFLSAYPEKLFPSKFWAVMLLQSHTIWHVCVLLAAYNWFHHLLLLRGLLAEHGCTLY